MAKKFLYIVNGNTCSLMYEIMIEPMGKKENNDSQKLTTSIMLGTMLDVMQQINESDDASFVLKLKLLNNIEFLVDQLMQDYENGK